MTNRIQPHPNPPYLKSDGTVNVSGQIKTFSAGTANAKIVYSDVSGTSYGSTVALNSSGLPTSGPIYWDIDNLYKVEVYTRTDDTPTYALDYTVDNFGGSTTETSNQITTAETWTVDGVGAGADEYATIDAALDATRLKTFVGSGSVQINLADATYLNETLNLSHPQGWAIKLVGTTEAGTIIKNTTRAGHVFNVTAGQTFGGFSTMTIQQNHTGAYWCIKNGGASSITYIDDVTFKNSQVANLGGINILWGSFAALGTITMDEATNTTNGAAVECSSGGSMVFDTTSTITVNVSALQHGIRAKHGAFIRVNTVALTTTGTEFAAGINCAEFGRVEQWNGTAAVTKANYGIEAVTGGMYYGSATPTYTTITTSNTNFTLNQRVDQGGLGSSSNTAFPILQVASIDVGSWVAY